MASQQRPHGDDGLQPERTALSWERTALSFTLISCFVFRHPLLTEYPVATLAGLALLIALKSFASIAGIYCSSSAGICSEATQPKISQVLTTGGAVFGLAALALHVLQAN